MVAMNLLRTQASNRRSEFRSILEEANNDIFITGLSLNSLTKYSLQLLKDKLENGNKVSIAMINKEVVRSDTFAFLRTEQELNEFTREIDSSLKLLLTLKAGLLKEHKNNFQIMSYSGFFPYVVTGYVNQDKGKLLCEIVDYLPDSESPRILLCRDQETDAFDFIVKKVKSLHIHHSSIVADE
jgi:hypothetical protein